MKKTKLEIQSFTGLRGISLWAVILYHLYPNKIQGGYLGVVVFFLLSGFLLMRNHLLKKERKPLQKFIQRWEHLTPPLVFMLTITSLFVAIFYRDSLPYLRLSSLSSIIGLNNWTQIFQGLSYFDLHGRLRPFTHLWALSAELQFYLIWALLLTMNKKKPAGIVKAIAFLSSLSFLLMMILTPFSQDPTRIYYGTDTRFFSFGMGCLFGSISTKGVGNRPQKNKSLSAGILLFLLFVSFLVFSEGAFLYYGGMFFISLVVGFLLLYTAKDDNKIAKFLSWPPFLFFGKRSYSYYLWQYSIMLVFQQIFSHSTMNYHIQVMIQVILLLFIGEISYQIWEKRRYKKKTLFIFFAILILISSLSFALQKEIQGKNKAPISSKESSSKKKGEEKNSSKNLSPSQLNQLSKLKGILIGDSITEGAYSSLKEAFPNFQINGKINRQMVHSLEILDEMNMEALPDHAPIVLQLGTNSDFHSDTLNQVIEKTAPHPLYLVNTAMPDPWEGSVNDKFLKASKENPRVHLIDWYTHSKVHEEYFAPDHTHPTIEGEKVLVNIIRRALLDTSKKEENP